MTQRVNVPKLKWISLNVVKMKFIKLCKKNAAGKQQL